MQNITMMIQRGVIIAIKHGASGKATFRSNSFGILILTYSSRKPLLPSDPNLHPGRKTVRNKSFTPSPNTAKQKIGSELELSRVQNQFSIHLHGQQLQLWSSSLPGHKADNSRAPLLLDTGQTVPELFSFRTQGRLTIPELLSSRSLGKSSASFEFRQMLF